MNTVIYMGQPDLLDKMLRRIARGNCDLKILIVLNNREREIQIKQVTFQGIQD